MLYEAEKGDFTLAAVGDAIITRHLAPFKEANFLKMVNLLRSCDCTFVNLETIVHEYEAWPALYAWNLWSDPSTLEDLKWAGFNLVSFANNHTFDWGHQGIFSTIRHLKQAGLVYSGAGSNLQEALMPGYLDTNRGRVALISVNDSFQPHFRASEQRPDLQGRPGENCLGFDTTYVVDQKALDDLKRISINVGHEAAKERQRGWGGRTIDDTETRFHFFDVVFELGREWPVKTRCNSNDLENNLKWIRAASRQADWVLVSLHGHAQGETPDMPADFHREFAHACIDAGAHAIIGHGPHFLRGIEIYQGRPILYSLGNFIFQLETIQRHSQENYERLQLGYSASPSEFIETRYASDKRGFPSEPKYWRSVVATMQWKGKELNEIRLHPIELGHGRTWPQRGRPLLADEQVGLEILKNLEKLSEALGSKMEVKDGVGSIRP